MNVIELQKLPDYKVGMTDAQVAKLKKQYAELEYINYNCELCLENDCTGCEVFEFELEEDELIELEEEVIELKNEINEEDVCELCLEDDCTDCGEFEFELEEENNSVFKFWKQQN